MDKSILESKDYDFLRKERFLNHNKVWYIAPVGMHGKGLYDEERVLTKGVFMNSKSDLNLKGYNPKSYCINKFKNKTEPEIEMFPVMRLCDLLYECDVNTINMFGVRDEDILVITNEGKWIRDNISIFISKNKVYDSYKKYAEEKTEKFKRIILRNSDTIENKLMLKRELYEKSLSLRKRYEHYDRNIQVYMDGDELVMNLNFQKFPVREFNNIMGEMKTILRGYNDIKCQIEENESSYSYAVDAISTYLIGIDILQGRGINTYREKELKLLNDIKDRKIHHNKIFKIINNLKVKFELAKQVSVLPNDIDYNVIKDILTELNMKSLVNA